VATAKKQAQAKAADREAQDAPDEKDEGEDVEEQSSTSASRSPANRPPAQGGKDPNQGDDDELSFSIKGNRISIDLEFDERAADTLRSLADLVDGLD
jgi:hypothetical protein